MQFDKGYLSPYFINQPAEMDCVLEDALHPDPREEDQQPARPDSAAGEGQPDGQAAVDHRRGRRGRGADGAGRQQAPRRAERLRREGPRLRRSPQGHARRHRHADRRHADQRRPGHEARERRRWSSSAAPRRSPSTRTTRRSSRAPASTADIQNRIEQIRNQIEATDSDYDREKFQERLAKLTGGVAIISVGAGTEAEMKQKKARVEDALHATRAAVEEGILPGGGVALLRCREAVEKARSQRQGRREDRRRHRAARAVGARCSRSPTTAASTARWWPTRSARSRPTPATTPTPASTSTCSRPASSTR